jgi:DNA-binding beta-propeller fold protein YncE
MFRSIQSLPQGQRRTVFWAIIIGGILLLIVATIILALTSVNSSADTTILAVAEGVTVSEFARLPDNDSYPASLAIGPDGTLYTGSYASGAVWRIDLVGTPVELSGTRASLGSIAGIAVGTDGSLYVIDLNDVDPRTGGGTVKVIRPDGSISTFADIPDGEGFIAPDDLAFDPAGNLYVTDRGRDEIWQFDPEGVGALWWRSVEVPGRTEYAPTGIAYDASNNAMVITDSSLTAVYRISMDGLTSIALYTYPGEADQAPVFDGIAVTPDGRLYITSLAAGEVLQLEGVSLRVIAGLMRGPSDLAYNPASNTLYASNFDSRALVIPGITPRLPFTIDAIQLPA